jgi:hypothetical protein
MSHAVHLQIVGQVENASAVLTAKDLERRTDLKEIVDGEIEAFDTFFQKLDNSSLTGPERALLHTFLWWKTHPTQLPPVPPQSNA